MKLVFAAISLVAVLLLAGYFYVEELVKDALDSTELPGVEQIPAASRVLSLPSYTGLSPSQIIRPSETFHFPIPYGSEGPITPLFALTTRQSDGSTQQVPPLYPFLCQSLESGLGQPRVDNQQRLGVAVYRENADGSRTNEVIGYSKDCGLPTRLHYFVEDPASANPAKPDFVRFDNQLPTSDVGVNSTAASPWIRMETGSINRFIYVVMMPVGNADQPDAIDKSRWNGKLVYNFKGAVGIGFQQGEARLQRLLRDMKPALEQGFAVVYSTGTETDFHYNVWLQEDTALRLKQQFISRYGKPDYTIGFGDSGGGLQQYLLAQNRPGLIDGGVAIIAYPDMVTQVTYGLDCELLEYYFDHLATDRDFWRNPQHRSLVEGLSYTNDFQPGVVDYLSWAASLMRLEWPVIPAGTTECAHSWRGISASVNNPRFNTHYPRYSTAVNAATDWNHWQDLRQVYGTDAQGYGLLPSDNRGVQYGLNAWKNGLISAAQFFDLNRKIGGWKPQPEMQQAHLWLASNDDSWRRFSPYGEHNMTHEGHLMSLAPRSTGSRKAAKAAWLSGNVFSGKLDIPLIDVRPYQDAKPDMHHSWSAVSSRSRIIARNGFNRWQSIWMSEPGYKARWDAFAAMDRWLSERRTGKLARDTIPAYASDRCINQQGELIASGDDVWDGHWNHHPDGTCTRQMPFFQSSRQAAGDDARATTLMCQRVPVAEAIRSGLYTPLDVTTFAAQLATVFPDGVCDFRLPGLGEQPLPASG